MPDDLIPRQRPDHSGGNESFSIPSVFLDHLVRRWEEIPLFLRTSLRELTGLPHVSLSDLFWVGGDPSPIHPLLVHAELVAVNRRIKRPALWTAGHDQPLYLVLKRDGRYLCGCCAVHNDQLLVHLYPGMPLGARHFRNGIDAEVIGQVTTILRRLA